jgi:hypothetical protein
VNPKPLTNLMLDIGTAGFSNQTLEVEKLRLIIITLPYGKNSDACSVGSMAIL